MKIFDISRPLFNGLAPWPGDTPFHFEMKWKMAAGASVNVGAVEMGVHNGSHADAPLHFRNGATPIDGMPLDIYLGEAVVVDLSTTLSVDDPREISIADLQSFAVDFGEAPRLLLKTGAWKDSTIFPAQIPVLAPDVPEWLGHAKVKLLGVDLPSVDPIDSKALPNHHALAAAGIAIVEGLDLTAVDPGVYHFAALPVRIAGGDAAPVRAILWRD